MILRTFRSRDPFLLFKAFSTYVRPLLDYCSPVWAPVYKSDIELIERVQRSFTKRLIGFKYLTYDERLRLLHTDSLVLRRLKSDLIMIFKIIHNFVDLNIDDFFGFSNSTVTRGHEFKLCKPFCNNNARQFSFACRRIDIWNSLPANIVNVPTVNLFKSFLNKVNFNNVLQLLTE